MKWFINSHHTESTVILSALPFHQVHFKMFPFNYIMFKLMAVSGTGLGL